MTEGQSTSESTRDWSEWLGRSETVTDTASVTAATGLAAILDRPTPGAGPDAGEPTTLFPLGHWLQFTPTAAMSELGPDGHPRLGGFMPPLPLPRRMWAGSSLEFHSPIGVGQELEKTTTIAQITPKNGSSGALCFVELVHEIRAAGTLAVTERQTIVYREAVAVDPQAPSPARDPRPDVEAPAGWDWSRSARPTTAQLFRYSAVTFNSHRIHYDLPYATEVEGYPRLVVHGPLTATLLLDAFLAERPGAQLRGFEFSARSPLFAGELIHLLGRDIEVADDVAGSHAQELIALAPTGKPAVKATVRFD